MHFHVPPMQVPCISYSFRYGPPETFHMWSRYTPRVPFSSCVYCFGTMFVPFLGHPALEQEVPAPICATVPIFASCVSRLNPLTACDSLTASRIPTITAHRSSPSWLQTSLTMLHNCLEFYTYSDSDAPNYLLEIRQRTFAAQAGEFGSGARGRCDTVFWECKNDDLVDND